MAKVLNKEPAADTDAFRLRTFVERMVKAGEAEIIEQNHDLADLAEILDGNEKAILFRSVGPEGAELVGNVSGSRKRIAAAFDVAEPELLGEVNRRLAAPQDIVELDRSDAPVQQVVLEGDDADLTKLPVHFQHGLDGAPYISASIDFVRDPETGLYNVGCRRLMLRGRRETGVDLVSPSDLRAIYEKAARRGEHLPVSFVVGAHPVDHIAATMRVPGDELSVVARLRGQPLGVVKSVTNDILVPADAEMVIEGYFHYAGHVESEGPFGEFLGYYGLVKHNPVFHVTAITQRRDALFQNSTIGGKFHGRTDTTQLCALRTEATVWRALETAVREPIAVHATPSSGGMFNFRISLRQRVPGEARNAIAAAFGSLSNVKNVFVVDGDIDVFSDEQMDWALGTRFQPHRDLMVEGGFRTLPLDPSVQGERTGGKAGFDCTRPFGENIPLEFRVPAPPELGAKRFDTVTDALVEGPKTFEQLMSDLGSRDGREIVLELEKLRDAGRLSRGPEGEWIVDEKA